MMKTNAHSVKAFACVAILCSVAISGCVQSGKGKEKAVEQDLSDPLSGVERLTRAGVRIARAGAVVYVDPIAVISTKADADAVLITHGHDDHYSVESINKLSRSDTLVFMPESLASRAKGLTGKVVPISSGYAGEVKGVAFTAFPSYNLKKDFHPLSSGNLGYSLVAGGKTYCVPGDTDAVPELLAQKADVLFLPCTATYTMGPEEAAAAAKAIAPGVLVPYHGTPAEVKKLIELIGSSVKVKELVEK